MTAAVNITKESATDMVSYKLFYFNARGGAEMTRLAFALGNIQYEDIRLEREEWPKEKASGRPPFGQMPFLVLPDGKILAQSGTICKFVCALGGFCPSDVVEAAQADMIFEASSDLRMHLMKQFLETDEAKKEELRKEFLEKVLAVQLPNFQKLLQTNNGGKGFFVGEKISYADLYFFDFFNNFMAKGEPEVPDVLKPFPLLVDHYNRVMNIPEIKAWIEKRPKTAM